jgi:histidine ammonia-lyase
MWAIRIRLQLAAASGPTSDYVNNLLLLQLVLSIIDKKLSRDCMRAQQDIALNGDTLTLDRIVDIARNGARVVLPVEIRTALVSSRAFIEKNWLVDDAPLMYAFNTGVGALKNQRIYADDIARFQRNLVHSHSASTGETMPVEVVRAMMAIRVNAFARNHSGIRIQVVDRLIAMLNADITPVIAAKGSVGASGDLAPLAIMAGALLGLEQSKVTVKGVAMDARSAFCQAGLPPTFDVEAKDGTALINGATASLAYAVLAAFDARKLLSTATVSLSLSLEAMRAERSCFEDRVMLARPHPGQRQVAAAIRRLLHGTSRCTDDARAHPVDGQASSVAAQPRIQDVYSFRCAPQVYGPILDALHYVEKILVTEMNSATDNPLIFESANGYDIVSCGHFHGQYVAQAMDILALAVTDLSAICDRRNNQLIDPACNYGLPRNMIAKEAGINTGFAVVQSMGTGLVLENMGLCTPASVTSLPAKGNQEDHISNSCFAARRTRTVVENAQAVVAAEILIAAQALDLAAPVLSNHPLGRGTQAAFQFVREHVPAMLGDDRWIYDDVEAVKCLVRDGEILDAVTAECGDLWVSPLDVDVDGRNSLPELIASASAKQIIRGELEPGDRVRQESVAREFDTSNGSVREAFRGLEARGLLMSRERRGTRVSLLDCAPIVEITRMRVELESLALRNAIPNVTEHDIARAHRAIDRARGCREINAWEEANRHFHNSLYRACGMSRLLTNIEDLHEARLRYMYATAGQIDWSAKSEDDHLEILDAIKARD